MAASASLSLDGHWASESDGEGHAVFNAEGIHCANCARSIKNTLGTLPGIKRADVNVVNSRVSVSWDPDIVNLGTILGSVAKIGFRPVPLVGDAAAQAQKLERRTALKRIGLAAIGSMQVMMYAGGLYAGAFQGIDTDLSDALRWTCLIVATPVLFYSGAPILQGAVHDLRRRVLGMDVTVSIALVLAYLASLYNTVAGTGEVYFDSVTMFILFLLLGRFVEMRGRHQTANVTDALARALPATAQRLDPSSGAAAKVPLSELRRGDRIRVGTGQIIPVDGKVLSTAALVDESLVTGESLPNRRAQGEPLLGGSINAGAAITLEVTHLPDESTLHGLVRLLERAQSERPRLGLAAERMASWFIVRILLLTTLVGLIWYVIDPARAFPAVLAVLVATCPCALSIATPVALAASSSRLAKLGVLVMRPDAIEGLASVDTVMLDKTGTLTEGRPRLVSTDTTGDLEPVCARAIAAALEASSQHPLAAAFKEYADPGIVSHDAHDIAGLGIEGHVDGVLWRIGKSAFALAESDCDDSHIVLADSQGRSARFRIADALRSDAAEAVRALQSRGLALHLASGDRRAAVTEAAVELGIDNASAELRPEDKLASLQRLQSAGHRVLMIGDGINDGPVLAAADVSMAMGRGSSIAHAAGDLLLLRESLASLPLARDVAIRTLVIVRQNLRWAVIYNMTALPLAAIGLMPPWVAALGMSLSSLLVVFNARRILRASQPAIGAA
jgi:Cu2+-exporting ATPase